MTPADLQRLAAILGMLGSDHAGERDNAAVAAEAFRKRHGLTWAQLLALHQLEPLAPEPESEPPPDPDLTSPLRPRYEPEQRAVDHCIRNGFIAVWFLAATILAALLATA